MFGACQKKPKGCKDNEMPMMRTWRTALFPFEALEEEVGFGVLGYIIADVAVPERLGCHLETAYAF